MRKDAVLLDVGSDHALLPIALVKSGQVSRAVATDLNEGPIRRASENIREMGLEGRILPLMRDGLRGAEKDGATDIVIAGMGGELIASILDAAVFLRDPALRLILQPMTKAAVLRSWLLENGFLPENDTLCRDGERIYQLFTARYAPEEVALIPPYTLPEKHFGRGNLARMDALSTEWLGKCGLRLAAASAGRAKMRRPMTPEEKAEEALLSELKRKGYFHDGK